MGSKSLKLAKRLYQKGYRRLHRRKQKQYQKEYYLKNKTRLLKLTRTYKQKNEVKLKEQNKQYYIKNKKEIRKKQNRYSRRYYRNNKQRVLKNAAKWKKRHTQRLKLQGKAYRTKNKARIQRWGKKYNNQYRRKNKVRIAAYFKQKLQNDPIYRFKQQVRLMIHGSFGRKDLAKRQKTEKLLGCSLEEFRKHIESQLPKGKSLKDLGRYGYHIDHIIPLATASTHEEITTLCHYTNLQPLWWEDNLKKSGKIDK